MVELLRDDCYNMLHPRGSSTLLPETDFITEKDFLPPESRPSDYRKNTVKEMLMMKRKKLDLSPVDNLEHILQSAQYDAFPALPSPNSNHVNQYAPESLITPQHPASPSAEVKLTLFHWQIQQEERRVAGLPPELLITQDEDGDTFLHIAVAQGRRALAYVLATRMAPWRSLDLREHKGQTALQIAAAANQHLIVQDLLAHGAMINTRDLWGRSPLHVCAEKGHLQSLQSIWRVLSGSKQLIDIEMINYDGFTPLHAAVMSHNAAFKEHQSLEVTCSYRQMELLQLRQMYTECIRTLLLMGASLWTKDLKSGRTCLHIASEEANVELLRLFVEQPSSASLSNITMFNGNTALHVVSSLQKHQGQVEAVKLLMKSGADPTIRNIENELPSQLVPDGPTGEKAEVVAESENIREDPTAIVLFVQPETQV